MNADRYPFPSSDCIVAAPKANAVQEQSFAFALETIALYKDLQSAREYVISKQLLRSGTSIGAQVEEALAAESRRDFLHKMNLALKEARETHYWLRLLHHSDLTTINVTSHLRHATDLINILKSISKTTAESLKRPNK